jgi:hypothetical protein
MNQPNYKDVLKDLSTVVVGDISNLEEDREKVARDTSLFYVKPEVVIFPRNPKEISTLFEYISEAKKHDIDL